MEVKAKSKSFEDLRAFLLTERARLLKEIAEQNVSTDQERSGYSSHMAEDASTVFEQAKQAGIRRSEERMLAEVEDALERMDTGHYGKCVRCGQQIDLARLKALPSAAMCLNCQTRAERR